SGSSGEPGRRSERGVLVYGILTSIWHKEDLMSFLRWVSDRILVDGLRELEFFGDSHLGDSRKKPDEAASAESIASCRSPDTMGVYAPDNSCYELLTIIGRGFEDLMTVNLARYKPSGEYVCIRRINLEFCTNDMVAFLQTELHVSKLFNHPNILPYRATFIANNELWNLEGYDAKSDIYSVGITACELANGHVPFKDMPATQMLLEKLNGTVPCLLDTATIPASELTMKTSRSGADSGIGEGTSCRPSNGEPSMHPYNRTFSPHFHNLVEQCLQRNPELRPNAGTLLNHSFFKQIRRRASEALPELLRPVSPITNFEGARSSEPPGLEGLVSNMEQLDVDDWDF
ncbi:hypothetical protein AB205_0113570, partial [Aquarana catesbeiana]